ncbi:uncharacterized protein EAF01_004218 [Botrytis porri]|uniref:Alpha/beta hydrolase fold-3 domain-containing protein n=1 Tax=Botrytis porri TaxID=87229 RepID=A0A4Z1KVY1_9HELO|nr:uncharacterized protein EAF01_004218 [Botrytis porri]KAF7908463.1 hypothetical protein EAF01_004218 [Botrytis porri]TGO88702.1 hypothetical protein BPOR_0146g00050 [Botrytis porri]
MSSSPDSNSHPLILTHPPPLNPAWESHIPHLPAPSTSTSPDIRKAVYSQNCINQNTSLLRTSLIHLTQDLLITSSSIPSPSGHKIPTRLYTPTSATNSASVPSSDSQSLIIYFHGGGLYVGNLDSEDLTCRQLSLSLSLTLLSVSYRLMPSYPADDAVSDALTTFTHLCTEFPSRKFILVGSSSGGQLAATVALTYLREKGRSDGKEGGRILGVLLRCPVTCDATDNGTSIPEEWKSIHTSMKEEFYTGILNKPAVTRENRVKGYKMPLEMLAEMPKFTEASKLVGSDQEDVNTRWFIQLCTNDIYYSDGVCLALGLKERGYGVKVRVEFGWPHTFWLKGMVLEEAQKTEMELVKGAKWILDRPEGADTKELQEQNDWVKQSEVANL